MTKEELIEEIQIAFKDVKLEDGIGLWEGQGLDDYADRETLLKLRRKDERDNWDNISYKDLAYCESSLSFFDAKGMRFCLPKFLILDILEKEFYKDENIILSCDIIFHLGYERNDNQEVFHLFNRKQIQCIIYYLEYKREELITEHKEYSINYGTTIESVYWDSCYMEIDRVINIWMHKLEN